MNKEKTEWFEVDVSFDVGKRHIHFKVIHNMPEIKGISFDDAFNSWLYRTKKYTDKSLIEYIMSKDQYGVIAMTEKVYKSISK